jgi:hypothetical protein
VHFDVVKVAAWIIVIAAARWLWDAVARILLRFVREFFPEDPADRPPGWTTASAWRAMLASGAWRVFVFLTLLAVWFGGNRLLGLLKRVAQEKHLLQ